MLNASRLKAQFTVALALMTSAPYLPRFSDFLMRRVVHDGAGDVTDLNLGAWLSELTTAGLWQMEVLMSHPHYCGPANCCHMTMLSQYCRLAYFLNRAWEFEF